MKQDNIRAKEFLKCLGNGKTICQIEDENGEFLEENNDSEKLFSN